MPMVCQYRHPVSHFEAASGQSAAFQPVTARGLQLPARIQIKKAAAIPLWGCCSLFYFSFPGSYPPDCSRVETSDCPLVVSERFPEAVV